MQLKNFNNMAQKVNLGGDRVGSGSKMEISLHNYHRSTHNLSYDWISSMSCGTLVPFMCLPILKGDTFDIELNAAARTIPSKGFLFGSFKMQMDVYSCPVRLYQAILHNNPTAIGLKMAQIKFPQIELRSYKKSGGDMKTNGGYLGDSSLIKYLGMSGIGQSTVTTNTSFNRYVNAIPVLAYYDIFKNYYANKQEENAYIIGQKQITAQNKPTNVFININLGTYGAYSETTSATTTNERLEVEYENSSEDEQWGICSALVKYSGNVEDILKYSNENLIVFTYSEDEYTVKSIDVYNAYKNNKTYVFDNRGNLWNLSIEENYIQLSANELRFSVVSENSVVLQANWNNETINVNADGLQLRSFPLKNLDDMRYKLLSYHQFGNAFKIDSSNTQNTGKWNTTDGESESDGYPYTALCEQNINNESANVQPNYGLCIKTYQSDIFNNWLDTELIDGENGIAEITKISVTNGAFKIDALNLGEKLYNMLNRVVASGNTLQDWENAVYTTQKKTFRHLESPVYLGGSSNEIVFDEIVQTTPNQEGALGTIGGKGMLIKRKGGKIHVKADEAAFIVGIASITPRLVYSQGNEWYMTELESYDDFHKPALDGIGYQNLIGERLAYWETIRNQTTGAYAHRGIVGKLPAWIEYMTNYDKAFGEFANIEKTGYTVLARNYEAGANNDGTLFIKDATTYIDPTKFNYAFAYTDLDAQNFWVQIRAKVIARRLMSAKQIPNL